MGPVILLSVLALPFIEIAGFIALGQRIGLLQTLLVQIAAMLLGALVLRRGGLSFVRRVQLEVKNGRIPAREIIEGAMVMVAGVVLTIPGLVKDIVVLPVLLPFVRQWLVVLAVANLHSVVVTRWAGATKATVVDLDPTDFHHHDPAPPKPIGHRVDTDDL